MTSFDPTSRWAMRPSGETLDLVKPGMSSVVGRVREAVVDPESCRRGTILGLFGAVVAGVSVMAAPCLPFSVWGARDPDVDALRGGAISCIGSCSCGDRLPSEVAVDAFEEGGYRWLKMAVFAMTECRLWGRESAAREDRSAGMDS